MALTSYDEWKSTPPDIKCLGDGCEHFNPCPCGCDKGWCSVFGGYHEAGDECDEV